MISPYPSLYIVYSTRPPPQQLPYTWALGYFRSSPHLHCEAIKVVHFSLTPVTFTWSTNRRNRSPSLTLIAVYVVCTTLPALTFHLFWWSGISHEVSKQLTVGFHAIVLLVSACNVCSLMYCNTCKCSFVCILCGQVLETMASLQGTISIVLYTYYIL